MRRREEEDITTGTFTVDQGSEGFEHGAGI